jgi:hypothetical protein
MQSYTLKTGLEFVSLEYIDKEKENIIKNKIKEIDFITKSAAQKTSVIGIFLYPGYESNKVEDKIMAEFTDWLIPRRFYNDYLNQKKDS